MSRPVEPQLLDRSPEDTINCTCRCAGPPEAGPYCACPTGTACLQRFGFPGLGSQEIIGWYCIRPEAFVPDEDPTFDGPVCDATLQNCEGR